MEAQIIDLKQWKAAHPPVILLQKFIGHPE